MLRGRRLWCLLAVGLTLIGAVFSAGPAATAAPCTGPDCTYRYWADISITAAWMTPSWTPIPPGITHSYMARVTNTGWRTGGGSVPRPWSPGPTSGVVYVGFEPGSPVEQPLGCRIDIGSGRCDPGYNGGLAIDCQHIPTDTTYQIGVIFRAPQTPGTYTLRIWIHAYQAPYPWTEYNPDNNEVTLTYQVGYLP